MAPPLNAARLLAAGLLALSGLSTTGCLTMVQTDLDGAVLKIGRYRLIQDDRKSPKGQYLHFKGKGGQEPRSGFARFGDELFAPFDYQLTTGGFDHRRLHKLPGQIACTEVEVSGTGPDLASLEFASICAQHQTDSWDVWVTHNFDGGPAEQSAVVPFGESDRMDLRVEAEADHDLVLSAKLPGEIDWTEVHLIAQATHGYDLSTQSLIPSIGATSLNKKGEMGFNNWAGTSADRPSPTTEEMVYDEAVRGIKRSLAACTLMEVLVPNDVAILQQMALAEVHFLSALLASDALESTKQVKKARNFLRRAVKASNTAAAKVNKAQYFNAASQLRKAVRFGEHGAVPFMPEVLQD